LVTRGDIVNEASERLVDLVDRIRRRGAATREDLTRFYRFAGVIIDNLDKIDEHMRKRAIYVLYDGLRTLASLGNPVSVPRSRALDMERALLYLRTIMLYGIRVQPTSIDLAVAAVRRTLLNLCGERYAPSYVLVHAIPEGVILKFFSVKYFLEVRIWRHEVYRILFYSYTCWRGRGVESKAEPFDEYVQREGLVGG